MIPKAVKRRIRPLWIAGIASAGWANRADVRRWAEFAKRAVTERRTRPVSDLVTEARARAAITADPLMRRDPTLKSLTVTNGIVTLLTTSATWPESANRMSKLRRVKGIDDVHTRQYSDPTSTDVGEVM
jgi:hypothetical protein